MPGCCAPHCQDLRLPNVVTSQPAVRLKTNEAIKRDRVVRRARSSDGGVVRFNQIFGEPWARLSYCGADVKHEIHAPRFICTKVGVLIDSRCPSDGITVGLDRSESGPSVWLALRRSQVFLQELLQPPRAPKSKTSRDGIGPNSSLVSS
jgi:hypothetical protein